MRTGELEKSLCILCGNCSKACRKTDPFKVIKGIIYLQKNGVFPDTYERTGDVVPMEDNPSRTELVPPWNGDDVHVMPGCVVRCKAPFLEYASSVAIRSMGMTCTGLEDSGCCLRPPNFSMMTDDEKRAYRSKIIESSNGNTVLSLCGGCRHEMVSSSLDVKSTIEFLHLNIDRLPKFDRPLKVAVEPGCEFKEMRTEMDDIVRALGFRPMDNDAGCCGKDTSVSSALMEEREKECGEGSFIVVACPKCFTEYDSYPRGKPVLFITELVALAAGDGASLRYHKIPVDIDSYRM